MLKRALCASAGLAIGRLSVAGNLPCGGPLLAGAIKEAGGRETLEHNPVFKWIGMARVYAGDKVIKLEVATTVAPFTYARSDSWLVEEGPDKTRTMIIEDDKGWMLRDGYRVPMPEAMLRHEKAQYALYGLMRLVTLCDKDCHLDVDAGKRQIVVAHPAAPKTSLIFDRRHCLSMALNEVPAADGSGTISQQIEFGGRIVSERGVHWPQRLKIAQNKEPYFELELSRFVTSPAIDSDVI